MAPNNLVERKKIMYVENILFFIAVKFNRVQGSVKLRIKFLSPNNCHFNQNRKKVLKLMCVGRQNIICNITLSILMDQQIALTISIHVITLRQSMPYMTKHFILFLKHETSLVIQCCIL